MGILPVEGKLYLVERFDKDTKYRYYAEHGEVGGIPDAIGYEAPCHARKFRTKKDAAHFICAELPEWGRELHRPVGLTFAGFDEFEALPLRKMLWCGIEIPADMLEPTAGRLRLWRCSGDASTKAG